MTPLEGLEPKAEPSAGDGAPRLRLVLPAGSVVLDGALLEGAFACASGETLVVTSDDVPYEEGVNLVLVGADGDTRDAYAIGAPYSTGTVERLAAGTNEIAFDFGGSHFTVRHDPGGHFTLPGAQPAGTSRRMAPWRRAHLKIERTDR